MEVKKLFKNAKIIGDLNRDIDGASPLSSSAANKLLFCKPGKDHLLKNISNCVVVLSKDVNVGGLGENNTYIFVDNPRLSFIRAAKILYTEYIKLEENDPTIHKSADISKSVYIGKNCFIGKNVKIYPHVTILCNTRVDDNVTIYPNTSIGNIGFGQERNECGELEKFPHIGGVHIGRNVEIGSNVSIDRGTLTDTVIGEGTMIDNLVHVAHNVKIGKHCEIICLSAIGGSVEIGDYSTISLNVCIRDGVIVGNNVLVGLGAVVTKNVPNNTTVAGNPAREINELRKYLKFIKGVV